MANFLQANPIFPLPKQAFVYDWGASMRIFTLMQIKLLWVFNYLCFAWTFQCTHEMSLSVTFYIKYFYWYHSPNNTSVRSFDWLIAHRTYTHVIMHMYRRRKWVERTSRNRVHTNVVAIYPNSLTLSHSLTVRRVCACVLVDWWFGTTLLHAMS